MADQTALPPTVSLRGVGHRFGDVQALDDLTFDVPARRITVLLGPNGAGKTTAIRSITGALSPKTGDISVFGTDPRGEGDQARPRCGVVSAKPALYDRLSGYDNLLYSAELYDVPQPPDCARRSSLPPSGSASQMPSTTRSAATRPA